MSKITHNFKFLLSLMDQQEQAIIIYYAIPYNPVIELKTLRILNWLIAIQNVIKFGWDYNFDGRKGFRQP